MGRRITWERTEKDHPGNGPDDPLLPRRCGDPVDRLPDHPGNEEPEEAGDDEDDGARNVCPPVAADVGTQGEELADGRPLKSEPGWG
jgi:hypothetical protein